MTDETRPVDPDDVLIRSEAVHTVELDDEAVLLDLASDRLHHLSATATIIWACLDGPSTVREITDDPTGGFDAPPGVVLADSLALLQAMTDDSSRRRGTARRALRSGSGGGPPGPQA